MRNRTYGGVRGRKMKVGGNYFIFLLLDLVLLVELVVSDFGKSVYQQYIHLIYDNVIYICIIDLI